MMDAASGIGANTTVFNRTNLVSAFGPGQQPNGMRVGAASIRDSTVGQTTDEMQKITTNTQLEVGSVSDGIRGTRVNLLIGA